MDRLFLQALEEVYDERFDARMLSLGDEEHVFGERHNKKLRRIIRRFGQPRFTIVSTRKRIAVIILAAVLLLTACTYVPKVVRRVIEDFTMLTKHDGFTVLTLRSTSCEGYPEAIEEVYDIGEIPEGYTLAFDDECRNFHSFTYREPNGLGLISLDQWTKSTFQYCTDIEIEGDYLFEDPEGFTYKVIECGYPDAPADAPCHTVFIWDNGSYVFSLHGDNLDKDEMLRLCKSTKIVR